MWDSPLWVVTSYYNPYKYRRRYENFQTFRRHLNAPLMVVELERNGAFQLSPKDGDMVMQLTGEDRIWQKECLLNIGIRNLPEHVKYVAWVDCDVLFGNPDWVTDAIAHLDTHGGLLELYDVVVDLTQEGSDLVGQRALDDIEFARKRYSAAYSIEKERRDLFDSGLDPSQTNSGLGPEGIRPSRGFAWAARRADIQSIGLYDRNVIGGGDWILLLLMEQALECGKYPSLSKHHLKDVQHYLSQDSVTKLLSNMSYSVNTIYHLWHGSMKNRRYIPRVEMLVERDYDPNADILVAENGTLQWSSLNSHLAQDVAKYFESRREDG